MVPVSFDICVVEPKNDYLSSSDGPRARRCQTYIYLNDMMAEQGLAIFTFNEKIFIISDS